MSHLQSYMQMHLDLACVKLADTEKELLTTKELCMKLEHRVEALENRGWPHFNVYTWKIGGLEQILRRAKTGDKVSIYSDPFYSGECSQKFRIRLFPNGDGRGKGTHLSLFLTNIEGEYDAILQWPFPKKVTLTLIDQQENLDERKTVSRPLTGTEEAWRSRPVKAKELDWGFCKFLSHDELHKRAYIVDDTIFIQAEFE